MASNNVVIVIPARYGSTRFPGKALALLAGRPLIVHTYERMRRVPGVARVIIATDDARIADAAAAVDAEVFVTAEHATGSDRVAEAARGLSASIVVNVQGDQPLIDPLTVSTTIAALVGDADADMATPVTPCRSHDEWQNPNVVCAVGDSAGYALYFSRAAIPYASGDECLGLRHLGVYAFRRAALKRFAALPQSPLELAEGLEQLRALQAGMRIRLVPVAAAPTAVDTPEQLVEVAATLAAEER